MNTGRREEGRERVPPCVLLSDLVIQVLAEHVVVVVVVVVVVSNVSGQENSAGSI